MTRLLSPMVKAICLEDYKYSHLHVTTGALFDINEVCLALGEQTADEYTPNMVTGPEPESSAADLLHEVLAGTVTQEDLHTSYAVINRYDELLRRKGYTL